MTEVVSEKPETIQNFVPRQKKVKRVKKKAKDDTKLTFFDHLLQFALKYTFRTSRILAFRLPNLRKDIERSNIRVAAEGILALAMFFTYITIPVVLVGIYVLYTFGLGLMSLGLIALIPVVPLIIVNIPKVSASSRSSAMDNELPYVVGYITVLAGGGISPFVTLKRLAKADSIFPAAAREARRILLDIEIFGMDAISALEKVGRTNPNRMFADFIGGYVAVLKTGGDALSYLEIKLREIFSYAESKVKRGSEFIGTMAEAYIIVTVVMGISLMILWSTENLLGGISPGSSSLAGSGSTTLNASLIVMFSVVFVPVISLVFIIVIGSAQTREPFSYDLPFYAFLAGIPAILVAYFIPFGLPQYTQLGIGLAIATTPGAILQIRHVARKKSVESKLSNFLRDISEVRKTGLAPEKTIEQLAGRNYGGLSSYVQRISSQLSWGTPIKTVLQNFAASVKSWLTRAMAFLLLEVVDVGGGSSKMFTDLADFTEKNSMLQKERSSMVKPFIMIPYVGAIMIVITTAMMIYFVNPPGLSSLGVSLASKSLIAKATNILLMCAFFQAWVMGFVAGKMGEESAADGFKHATLLVVLSLIAVYVSFTLINTMKF